MKTVIGFLFLVYFHSGFSQQCIDPNLINELILCSYEYDPVCGCDGNSYFNECMAKHRYGIKSYVLGNCNETVLCIDSSIINSLVLCDAVYSPVCGCDGNTYANECIAQYTAGVTQWVKGECLGQSIIDDTGTGEIDNQVNIKIYPTLINDHITIEGNFQNNPFSVFIHNQIGSIIFQREIFINEDKVSIENLNLPSGVYFIRVLAYNSEFSSLIIKI